MDRRSFLGLVGATPVISLAGIKEEKPIGFDLPKVTNLEELKIAVDGVTKHFNRRFNGIKGPAQAVTHKGNEYKSFVNGFPKIEGIGLYEDTLPKDPQKALEWFYWGIEGHSSNDSNKKLVWRVYPECSLSEDYPGRYKIRTRLVFE